MKKPLPLGARLMGMIVLLLLGWLYWPSSPVPPPAGPDVSDYLIQNVCIDASDRPIAEDPAICSKARDLRVGEEPPYVLTDYDFAYAKRYQTLSSKPQADGRIMVRKLMRPLSEDGYDLIERQGSYVSIVRTSDGGCGEQIFSGAGEGDGWILFPTGVQHVTGSVRHAMRLERLAPPPQCPHHDRVSTVRGRKIEAAWSPPQPFRFESGKTLLAIRTEHRAHHDLSRRNNAIEVFYFTREYGFSRWEAWQPEARCLERSDKLWCRPEASDSPLRGRCKPTGARQLREGQAWVRIDCRDTTFFRAMPLE